MATGQNQEIKLERNQKMKYKPHPAANLFPMMGRVELEELKADIEANGIEVDGMLFDGMILDGRNRARACEELGIEMEWMEIDIEAHPDFDPLQYVMSHNLHRRHLTTTQRAMVAAKIKPVYEKQAKDRQLSKLKQSTVPVNLPERNSDARDEAGKQLNVSGKSVDQASKVLESGSKLLVEAVESGSVAVSAAAKLAEKPKAEQSKVIQEAQAAGVSLKSAVSKAVKVEKPEPPKAAADEIGDQYDHPAVEAFRHADYRANTAKKIIESLTKAERASVREWIAAEGLDAMN